MGWRFRVGTSLSVTNQSAETLHKRLRARPETTRRRRVSGEQTTSRRWAPPHTTSKTLLSPHRSVQDLAGCGEKATAPAVAASTLHMSVEAPGDSGRLLERMCSLAGQKNCCCCCCSSFVPHTLNATAAPQERGLAPLSQFQRNISSRSVPEQSTAMPPPIHPLPPNPVSPTQHLPATVCHCCCFTPSGLW